MLALPVGCSRLGGSRPGYHLFLPQGREDWQKVPANRHLVCIPSVHPSVLGTSIHTRTHPSISPSIHPSIHLLSVRLRLQDSVNQASTSSPASIHHRQQAHGHSPIANSRSNISAARAARAALAARPTLRLPSFFPFSLCRCYCPDINLGGSLDLHLKLTPPGHLFPFLPPSSPRASNRSIVVRLPKPQRPGSVNNHAPRTPIRVIRIVRLVIAGTVPGSLNTDSALEQFFSDNTLSSTTRLHSQTRIASKHQAREQATHRPDIRQPSQHLPSAPPFPRPSPLCNY